VIGDTYVCGQLALVPTRLALALMADGWMLRSSIVWAKPNAVPSWGRQTAKRVNGGGAWQSKDPDRRTRLADTKSRQGRDVWTIPTERKYSGAMPVALAEKCIQAGCPPGGTVLDPFVETGTTLVASKKLGRCAIGIDASEEYVQVARRRIGEARSNSQAATR
jgi:DNA methylase